MSTPDAQVFNTMDIRPWNEPRLKNTKQFKTSPHAVGFPIGLTSLDMSKDHNIRINAHTEADTEGFVKVHLESWADTVLYTAGCTWLEVYAKDPDFQFGKFSTIDVHPWDQPQMHTSQTITFPKKFSKAPPKVIVWLCELDMASNANWRVKAHATDITEEGFTIHIDTWADTTLYSGTAWWMAYPSHCTHIASGSYNTMDVRPWNVPQLVNQGHVQFDHPFRSPPKVLTALNCLDIDRRSGLRIASATSDVTSEGMAWNINAWSDTVIYSAGASYIAIDEKSRCSHQSWRESLFLKSINILLFIILLGSNICVNPYNGKETYITPAPWAFLIWSLIHLLLFGTVVYQFFPGGKRVIIDGISWRFPLLVVFSSIYVQLWVAQYYVLAFIFAIFVSSIVTHIYYVIKKCHPPQHYLDELLIHLPFSLYHGWTTVLIVLAAFSAFGADASTHPANIWTDFFVFLALFFLEGTAAAYSFSTPKGDLPGSIAITWSLFAIFAHQTVYFIHWSALAFAIISLIWVIKAAIGRFWGGGGAIRLVDAEGVSTA